MDSPREDAVRLALELAPTSIRALAHEAGVSESLLRQIRDGARSATPATVEALAAAMERWIDRSGEAARILRGSIESPDRGGPR